MPSCELLSNQYLCSCKHNNSQDCKWRLPVVNCFQISIFAVANTTLVQVAKPYYCCELLSNQYLCSCKHNLMECCIQYHTVVNCFQISIFAVANTTDAILLYFRGCCELLSNQYLCSCKHNYKFFRGLWLTVVNCFQISIFAVANTTEEQWLRNPFPL